MKLDKQTVMLELLKEAWVYVHIDPRRDGVLLPDFLREQPRVVLQYGYNMPVPIRDLTVDERGISATLSFRRVTHSTFIPWAAVFAMTDGEQRGMVWQEDLPPDLQLAEAPESSETAEAKKPSAVSAPTPIAAAHTGSGPVLKSVPLPKDATPISSQTPRPAQGGGAAKKPRPSHLKLVD